MTSSFEHLTAAASTQWLPTCLHSTPRSHSGSATALEGTCSTLSMAQQQLLCAGSSARLRNRTVIWQQLLKQSREGARAIGHALQTACVRMLLRPWCRLYPSKMPYSGS